MKSHVTYVPLLIAALVATPVQGAQGDAGRSVSPAAGRASPVAPPAATVPQQSTMQPAAPAVPAPQSMPGTSSAVMPPASLMQLDSNRDGYISSTEARGSIDVTRRFYELDRNRDGRIDGYEFNAGVPSREGPDKRLQHGLQ